VSAPELAGVETFRLLGYDFDARANVARFDYAFDDTHYFREIVDFGGPPLRSRAGPGIEAALRLVHLAAGVSYYKAAAPGRVVIETGPLRPGEAGFVHDLYDKGLREFAVTNGLAVPVQLELESATIGGADGSTLAPGSGQEAPPPGIAVPVGGGKDSIVLVEALKAAGPPPELPVFLVAVNRRPAMERTAEVAGLPLASIRRTLSPRLLELNSAGALNGHVPITAIVSLIVVAAGYVYGYDTTLVALERSADEATSLAGGVAVNHQWSKSTECELALRSVVRESVSRSIEYASPLRSCGELEIARWFADLGAYHGGFRSCNRVFRSGTPFDGWCGACAKCRFVFLVLAPFLDPEHLVAIFGRNLLDDPEQVEGFRDLFVAGRKPYECVGEQRESLLAFVFLLELAQWRDTAVVVALRSELERHRPLVAADLDNGLPVLEGRGATREHVVRFISHLLERERSPAEPPRTIAATEWSVPRGAGPIA
jgi:UDP-N-acetyl-alpha-D-muramoyl-L-alanyl-L-glutamate epimerase